MKPEKTFVAAIEAYLRAHGYLTAEIP